MVNKFIIAFHVFITLAFIWSSPFLAKANPKKAHIHFKYPAKKTIGSKALATSTISAKKPPLKKQAAIKKAETKKSTTPKTAPQPVKKTKQASPKTTPAKELKPFSKETIAKIEEKIDKLEKITKGESQTLEKTAISSLIQDFDEEPNQITFVVSYLFELLELPGPGKVMVDLSIDENGMIENIKILESENNENSNYLIQALKNLVLPFEKKGSIPSNLKVCFSNLQA
jgi:outer membrane biosynthesis protein TonB